MTISRGQCAGIWRRVPPESPVDLADLALSILRAARDVSGGLLPGRLRSLSIDLPAAVASVEGLTTGESDQPVHPVFGGRPSLEMLADLPVETEAADRLGFSPFADALAELIDNPQTSTPLTVAISAPWGAGKTSLAKMVAKRLVEWPTLRGRQPHVVCWFNAWMHDDAPSLGAAMAAEVARATNRYRGLSRFLRPLPGSMLTHRERFARTVRMGVLAFAVAGVAVVLIPSLQDLFKPKEGFAEAVTGSYGVTVASIVVGAFAVFSLGARLTSLGQAVARFIIEPRSEAAKGTMKEVADQLGRLLGQATRGGRRVVIFVDDLERCRPPRAVEVCEVASQLIAHPDVVTIFIADMSTVARSADIKYKSLEGAGLPAPATAIGSGVLLPPSYGRSYLQKMVQIQFDLPPPPEWAIQDLLREGATRPGSLEGDEDRGSWVDQPRTKATARIAQYWTLRRIVMLAFGLLLWFSVAVAGVALVSGDPNIPSWLWIPGAVSALFMAVGLVSVVADQSRARRRAERVDEVISGMDDRSLSVDEGAIVNAVRHSVGTSVDPDLIRQRYLRQITDESRLREEAESEIISSYLPALPRSAKRMLNHLRLLLAIAARRNMFGGTPQLSPRLLARWVVMNERWPDVAWAIRRTPGELAGMEAASGQEALQTSLQRLGAPVEDPGQLLPFLQATPRVSDVLHRLLHFEAA